MTNMARWKARKSAYESEGKEGSSDVSRKRNDSSRVAGELASGSTRRMTLPIISDGKSLMIYLLYGRFFFLETIKGGKADMPGWTTKLCKA